MKLTDEDKRRLYVFLDEKCGHEGRNWFLLPCPKCSPRSFVTPDDVYALINKLAKDGMWRKFYSYAQYKYMEATPFYWQISDGASASACTEWLFRLTDENGDPHFASLFNEFLKGEGNETLIR